MPRHLNLNTVLNSFGTYGYPTRNNKCECLQLILKKLDFDLEGGRRRGLGAYFSVTIVSVFFLGPMGKNPFLAWYNGS